jgi:hypothetical protein
MVYASMGGGILSKREASLGKMFCFSYASMGGGFLLKREARETES